MSHYGADVDQLEGLARTLATVASTMEHTLGQVQSALHDAQWTGPAADQFRSDWTTHAQELRAAKGAIGGLALDLRKQAEDQRRASGASAGAPLTTLMSVFGIASGSKLAEAMSDSGSNNRRSPGETGVTDRGLGEGQFLRTLATNMPRIASGLATLEQLKPSAAEMLSVLGDRVVSGQTSIGTSTTWNVEKVGHGTWGDYSLSGGARVGAEADVSGYAGIRNGHLEAGFSAGAEIGATIDGHAKADIFGFVPVGVKAEAMAGASADAAGTLSMDEEGIHAGVSGDAIAGVRANADGTIGEGDYAQAKAGAGAWAGAGVKFDATADFAADNIELSFDAGAAIGLGAEFSVGFRVNPEAMYDDVTDAIEDYVVRGISDTAARASDVVGDTFSAATDAVSGAASKGLKAVGSALGSLSPF